MTLCADSVSYTYGAGTAFECAALDSVSLEVAPGELALVVGRTGSGKSTLLRVLAGLIDASAGGVSVDGDALTSTPSSRLVGIVFQDPETQLFAETVIEDVMFGPRNLGTSPEEAHRAAEAALAAVGLDPDAFGDRSPFALSGGEARRAAIAGVLAMDRPYLLLDEPTAGLDASGRLAVLRAVDAVREGAGVIVVSHDSEQWLTSADKVLVLDAGREAFSGPADELVAHPQHLSDAGLRPPEVLRAWELAREHGLPAGEPTSDPEVLAGRLAPAGGVAP